MKIIDVEKSDIPLIVGLLLEFHKEGNQDVLTPDVPAGMRLMENIIDDANYSFRAVVTDDAEVAGFYMFGVELGFFEERQAYLQYFYVAKRFRDIKTANGLMRDMVKTSDDMGVKMLYAASTAGIDSTNERAFTLLLKRQGFKVLGTTLLRTT